jgi:hypothetical protein
MPSSSNLQIAQLNKTIDEMQTCNSLITLYRCEKIANEQLRSTELNWFQAVWYAYKITSAVRERSRQLQPKKY